MQICKQLLKDSTSATATPVPAEVVEAANEELREPWMDRLDEWTRELVRPTDSVKDAATAATVRDSFFETCTGELQKREIGMRLAQKGFHELPPKTLQRQVEYCLETRAQLHVRGRHALRDACVRQEIRSV